MRSEKRLSNYSIAPGEFDRKASHFPLTEFVGGLRLGSRTEGFTMKLFLCTCVVSLTFLTVACKHPSASATSSASGEPPYKKPATFDVQGSHTLGKIERLDTALDE